MTPTVLDISVITGLPPFGIELDVKWKVQETHLEFYESHVSFFATEWNTSLRAYIPILEAFKGKDSSLGTDEEHLEFQI